MGGGLFASWTLVRLRRYSRKTWVGGVRYTTHEPTHAARRAEREPDSRPILAPCGITRPEATRPAFLQAQFRTLATARARNPHPAQGTSTESSVGESRATTYSAGSESDRFWSKWVSRGGT